MNTTFVRGESHPEENIGAAEEQATMVKIQIMMTSDTFTIMMAFDKTSKGEILYPWRKKICQMGLIFILIQLKAHVGMGRGRLAVTDKPFFLF